MLSVRNWFARKFGTRKFSERHLNGLLFLSGILALVLGGLYYVYERPASRTYLIPDSMSQFDGSVSILGMIGGSLPTFLHAFALCLMTIAVVGLSRKAIAWVCLCWLLIDSLFELGQIPAVATLIAPHVPAWFETVPVLENTANYFLLGRFDLIDLAAIMLGALCAYTLAMRALRYKQAE